MQQKKLIKKKKPAKLKYVQQGLKTKRNECRYKKNGNNFHGIIVPNAKSKKTNKKENIFFSYMFLMGHLTLGN